MTSFRIREFAPADNAGVLEVARTLGIPARVRLGIDRSPDFCAFSRALNEENAIVVAEAAGEIVGFVEFCAGRFRVLGEDSVAVHVPLGGVRPDWRRRGVFSALRAEAFQRAQRLGALWGYILVNANNRLMQGNLRRAYPGLVAVNRLLVHGIVAQWPAPADPPETSHIHPLAESDWPELLDFIAQRMQAHDVYPQFEPARWCELPGCSATHYRVARARSGRMVACLGSWDAAAFKRALILGYGRLERALLRPVNWCLGRAGMQPFPEPGGPLRTLYALCPFAIPGHEPALGQLLAGLRRQSRGYSTVLLAFPEGDPRNAVVRRFAHFTNVNIPFLIPLSQEVERAWRQRSPRTLHIEYAFA
jgi:GNAT superfamily N-acetyltransferase